MALSAQAPERGLRLPSAGRSAGSVVIGNDTYLRGALLNGRNDARAVPTRCGRSASRRPCWRMHAGRQGGCHRRPRRQPRPRRWSCFFFSPDTGRGGRRKLSDSGRLSRHLRGRCAAWRARGSEIQNAFGGGRCRSSSWTPAATIRTRVNAPGGGGLAARRRAAA